MNKKDIKKCNDISLHQTCKVIKALLKCREHPKDRNNYIKALEHIDMLKRNIQFDLLLVHEDELDLQGSGERQKHGDSQPNS